jgi:hypothetical protein
MSHYALFPGGRTSAPLHNPSAVKGLAGPADVPPPYNTVPRPPPTTRYRPVAYPAPRTGPKRCEVLMRRVVDFGSKAAAV